MPSLKIFSEQMEAQGITVLGVSVDYDTEALEKFVVREHLKFPIVHDAGQNVSARYGTYKYPETYVIDPEGRVSEKLIGAINWQDARIASRVRSLAAPGNPAAR